MKRLLFFFLLLITGFARAQNPCPCQSLRLSLFTGSDPTPQDGWIWYRSDTDKLRLRANGVTDNVATEGYVTSAVSGFWPLSGSPSLTSSFLMTTPTGMSLGLIGTSIGFGVDNQASELLPDSPFDGEEYAFMAGSDAFLLARIDDNGGIFYWDQGSPTFTKPGLRYIQYDSTDWTDSTLVTRAYVDGKVAAGAFMPLTGTGVQTGDVTISGSDNIGLGVTPTHKLHIQGGSDLLLIEDGDGTDVFEVNVEGGRPTVTVGDLKATSLRVMEGTNMTMGSATLSSGTITVNTTQVTANSRIFLTVNGGTLTNVGTPYVSARTPGTSFTITSTNGSDASDVAWIIIEPQ